MTDLTDYDITRLCARAIDLYPSVIDLWSDDGLVCYEDGATDTRGFDYNPLRDDAQAMALEDWLLERGALSYTDQHADGRALLFYGRDGTEIMGRWHDKATRRRAICLCVARMERAREGGR